MPDTRRYYGLDALRGAMMLLGIVLHAAVFYISYPPPHLPFVGDASKSLAMDAITHFIHNFRMPCFFVLAGFFTALLVEKRGVAGTWRNRWSRIGLPFVVGMVTLLPVTLLFMLDFMLAVSVGIHTIIPSAEDMERLRTGIRAQGVPAGIPMMHLWFLLYLLYFYLLIPVCRLLVRWSLPFEAPITRFLASPAALLVFSLITAATLWPFRGGEVFGPFILLGFDGPAFVYYGFFFVIGYGYHHYRAATAQLVRYIPWTAAIALLLYPLTIYVSHLEYGKPVDEVGWHVLAIAVHALCTWATIWLFVGLALKYFDRPTPWILYASNSAYWVFLLHLPVQAFLAWLLVPWEVHALVKFSILVAGATVVCFTTYHYWVQGSWLGQFLHGQRFKQDWPWRAEEGAERQLT